MADEHNFTLAPQDELPIQAPSGIPGWTENYCFQAYDPTQRIGFFQNLGTTNADPLIWRELLTLYLPDGTLMLAKGFGGWATPDLKDGPRAASQSFVCEEPWKRWRVRWSGPARHVTLDEISTCRLRDGLFEPVEIDLMFEAIAPTWNVGSQMETQSWAHGHYDQSMSITGTLQCKGQRYAIEGVGLRDHSRGPRSCEPIERHGWIHGEFEDGRCFSILDFGFHSSDAQPMSRGFVSDGKALHEIAVIEVPHYRSLATVNDPGRVVFDSPWGRAEIEGEVLANALYCVIPPNEVTFGIDAGFDGLALTEAQVRYRWDGVTGYGLWERTGRGVTA
jgi:hypothetical protein